MGLRVDGITKTFTASDGGSVARWTASRSTVRDASSFDHRPSGCGSRPVQIIGGLLASDAAGRDRRRIAHGTRHAIAWCSRRSTFPWRTVLDNVAFPLELARVPKAERIERARISSGWSARRLSSSAIRRSCRAACASARRWPGLWRFEPRIVLMDEAVRRARRADPHPAGDKVPADLAHAPTTTLLITQTSPKRCSSVIASRS